VAIADSDGNFGVKYDVGLFTPSIDMSGLTSVTLSVDKNFQANLEGDEASISIYSGGTGTSYFEEELWYSTVDDPAGGEHYTAAFDPSGYSDPSNVYIEFWYSTNEGTWVWYFIIDNVVVGKTVINQDPNADFDYAPTLPATGQEVSFDASSSSDPDGTIDLYEWDWNDDGTYDHTSTSTSALHTFTTAGTHTVTLRITDDEGASDTYSTDVVVNARPQAMYSFSPASPLAGQTITFNASPSSDSDGTIVLFEWDWDDDGTYDDTGALTTFYYVEAGLHDVTLRVTDDSGATDTFTDTISIRPQVSPLVSFIPLKNTMLSRANTLFAEMQGQLPEGVSDDVASLLDQITIHMGNATSTANMIYANSELMKAVELMEEILSLI